MADTMTPADRIAAIQAEDAARLAERRELDIYTLNEVVVAATAAHAALVEMEAALNRLVGDFHRAGLREMGKGNLSGQVKSVMVVSAQTIVKLSPPLATADAVAMPLPSEGAAHE